MNEILKERTSSMQITSLSERLEERVDLIDGRAVLEFTDFDWEGSLLPVSIRHVYNSKLSARQYTSSSDIAVADFSAMKLGFGWRLNIMQSMVAKTVDGETKYYYTDGEGNTEEFVLDAQSGIYRSTQDSDITYSTDGRLTMGRYVYTFENSRLVSIKDTEPSTEPTMTIEYLSGRINRVVDGAGRAFTFAYNSSGNLTSITAPDASKVTFGYSGYDYNYTQNENTLNTIVRFGSVATVDSEGNTVYSASNTRSDMHYFSYGTVSGNTGGLPSYFAFYDSTSALPKKQRDYVFNSGKLISVTERYDIQDDNSSTLGAKQEYAYSDNSCSVSVFNTDDGTYYNSDKTVKTVYVFNENGSVLSSHVSFFENGVEIRAEHKGGMLPFNPYANNQAFIGFETQNLVKDPYFENTSDWIRDYGSLENLSSSVISTDETKAYHSERSLILDCTEPSDIENGYVQELFSLPAGTYTFSAYVKITDSFYYTGQTAGFLENGVYLGVMANGGMLNVSESIGEADDFHRLGVTFTLDTAEDIVLVIRANGSGVAYISSPQLEKDDWYNEVNLIKTGVSGLFPHCTVSGSVAVQTYDGFENTSCLRIGAGGSISQTYNPKSSADILESFIFSAWARKTASSGDAQLSLRAKINYSDGSFDEFSESFGTSTVWNKSEVYFAKKKFLAVTSVELYCESEGVSGEYLVDAVSLVRSDIERGLTQADFEQGETEDDSTITDTEVFEEVKDSYGNLLTETVFEEGQVGALYRSFAYSATCDKISETDNRGNTTCYGYDLATSRITSVTDRLGNRTDYTYDENGRVARAEKIVNTENGEETICVDYEYDANGKLCKIINGKIEALPTSNMPYTFTYNTLGMLVNANGMVSYDYKAGSGRLKSMTYANGWEVKLSYDRFGKIVAEKWYYNNSSIPSYEYEYAYNKSGELVRSIDKTALREYTYSYREGTLVKICECEIITLDTTGEVSAREPVNIIACEYGRDGELSKKVYSVIGMSAEYTSGENTSIVKHLMAGTEVDTVTSVSDHLGRITGEQVKVGNTALITRAFEYAPGVVSAVHTSNNKVPSAPTTNLVSRIAVGNRSFQYTYDAEEKITSVVDSNGQSVVYTYDEQGRLTRETSSSGSARYIYDRFGNIIEKGDWDEDTNSFAENENHMVFTYYNSPRDRIGLIQGGKSGFSLLQYDNAGNPTTYKDSINLTWEKGRQLKTYGDHSFTYNANGIRTSRSYQTAVNGTSVNVRYDYYLEGTKPVRIKLQDSRFGNPEMLPLYDTSDSPIGIFLTRDGTSGTRVTSRYWYVKNLQGDVVAIRDESGTDVVQYSYNAWGKVIVVSDTTTFSLSTLNPFLYRSYLYDSETGLYYLQSRYYDPEIGRFINADEPTFIPTGKNLVINAFAYCSNDPVNMVDYWGTDAIWLQATESVAGLGHTGLIFKCKNAWYYWYWGGENFSEYIPIVINYMKNFTNVYGKSGEWAPFFGPMSILFKTKTDIMISSGLTISSNINAKCILALVSVSDKLNEWDAKSIANSRYDSKTKFGTTLYFEGDFDKTYELFDKLKHTGQYNLLNNNCMQTTVDGLLNGKFKSNGGKTKERLRKAKKMVFPNLAYKYLKQYSIGGRF